MCKGVKPLWNGTQTLYDQYILLYPPKREWGGGLAGWQAEPACTSALTGRDFNRSPVHYKKRTASHRIFRAAGWQAEPAPSSRLRRGISHRSPRAL